MPAKRNRRGNPINKEVPPENTKYNKKVGIPNNNKKVGIPNNNEQVGPMNNVIYTGQRGGRYYIKSCRKVYI